MDPSTTPATAAPITPAPITSVTRAPRSAASTRRRHVHVGLVVVFVGLLGACAGSDDSNSDSDLDTFCEEITALAQSDADTTEAEDVAALRSLADAAPSAISGDLDDMVDGLRQLQGFDAETASDEEMAGFLDMIDGLDEASVRVEEFALANCADMPADLFATP